MIAKIEKAEALEELDAIISASDAVMVARGDLGTEIGPAAVPLVQKRIISAALERGKPAITATQMLESMLNHPEPTRAEASDVANAILDGTSAVMLSGETAVGRYPVESVEYMDRIARAVEPSLPYRHELARAADQPFPTVGEAMSNAACDIAEVLGAAAICVPTYSGRTASRWRATARGGRSSRRRTAPRGPADGPRVRRPSGDRGVQRRRGSLGPVTRGRSRDRLVQPGDRVVITAGTAVNVPGTTNVIKVETA